MTAAPSLYSKYKELTVSRVTPIEQTLPWKQDNPLSVVKSKDGVLISFHDYPEEIVTAVNAHAGLVEALKTIVYKRGHIVTADLDAARAALAAAGEQTR